MESARKESLAKWIVAITGTWVAGDALTKLFATPISEVTDVFQAYGLLDWMIFLAWAELFVALLYLRSESRLTGYITLMLGMAGVTAIHLANGGNLLEPIAVMTAATAALLLREPELPEHLVDEIKKTLHHVSARKGFDH
ncbi:MAG: hypothetical protein R3281_08535 [Balneolaceae bacterium]|nr:hypothetical protein [Balneolaceae bacterium]